MVYMVEGYTDVLAMHQCGIENVVANSGTALNEAQIHLLHRFTNNITLLYDGDEAGIHAAMRGTDMLLAEAMNVKVLLLPDGDDPDSFSRKHTAQEFKEYIDSHQTDFIQFKTDLLLKGVSDPIKKAEAINNIIRSIAVIPDPMVRTAYIKDCSQRLDVDERTLISQTNKYIAGEREEAEKRIAREQEREQEAPQPTADLSMTGLTPKDKEVERLLVKNIIRHGNEVIFSGMETEDGQFIDINVAQYIDYDLGSDGLTFSDDRYNRILQEAVAHSADPGFESERYFMQHPDPQISQLAASIGIESHQLSRNFALNEGETQLRQRITHLILDFRMDIVSQQLKVLQRQLKEAGSDMQRIKELMTAYQDAQTLRNELARRLGSDVIVS
jgi:DNA primase